MKMLVLAGLIAVAPADAQTMSHPPAPAPEDSADMETPKDAGAMGHESRTYTFTTAEVDYTRFAGDDAINWDAEGWIGGDRHKLWWRSEGETKGPRFEQAEFQALYSRNIWTFFDAQAGIRYDVRPDARGYAVVGVQGLARYFFETQVHAYFGFKGDALVRLRQSFDLRLTNRLVIQPNVETDFYLTSVPERLIRPGFAIIETGFRTRYDLSRKFAPYVAVVYERRLGGSARLAQAEGENVGGWTVRGGLRVWF